MNELSRNEAIYLINRAQIIFTWTMEWIQMDSNFQVEINRGNRRAQTRLISTIFPFPSFSYLSRLFLRQISDNAIPIA